MPDPIRQDLDAPFWSIGQAAQHFGITRRSVRRYIAGGLPVYFGGTMVKPEEYIAEVLARRARQRESRSKRSHDIPGD